MSSYNYDYLMVLIIDSFVFLKAGCARSRLSHHGFNLVSYGIFPMVKNRIIVNFNSRVLIGLAIMVYEPL